MTDLQQRKLTRIGPEVAGNLLTHCLPDHQRRFDKRHCNKLASIMRQGNFRQGDVAIAIVNGGTKALANGQHTLRAIVQTGLAQDCVFAEYRCDDWSDYAKLFASFDTEEKRRTWKDTTKAFCMGSDVGLTTEQLNRFRSGAEYFEGVYGLVHNRSVTRHERLDHVADEYADCVPMYAAMWREDKAGVVVRKAPAAAAMIGTIKADANAAETFWKQIISGWFPPSEHGNDDYPPARLRDYLLRVRIVSAGGQHGQADKRCLGINTAAAHPTGTQMDIFIACVRTWNAFIRGDNLKLLRSLKHGQEMPKFARRHPFDEVA